MLISHPKLKIVSITLVIAFVALLAYIFYSVPDSEEEKMISEVPEAGEISMRGSIVCLPHRNSSGPQTLECAFGLRDSIGRYYGLRDNDPEYRNVSGAPMNTTVLVQGTFTPIEDTKYASIGVIEVQSITLATTTKKDSGENEESGIIGKVLLGPTCPVMRDLPDPECNDRPFETALTLITENGSKIIKTFSSNKGY